MAHSLFWVLLILGSFFHGSLLVLHIGVIHVQVIEVRLCVLSFADVSAFMEDGVKFSHVPSSQTVYILTPQPWLLVPLPTVMVLYLDPGKSEENAT